MLGLPLSLRVLSFLALLLAWSVETAFAAPQAGKGSGAKPHATAAKSQHHPAKAHTQVKRQRGKASYYHRKFAGRKMADGTPMNPNAPVAASKTLPLGTKAKVKNLKNGKSTMVEIRDRGPYVGGRIIDLSPKAAEKLDMKEDGVAPVEVTPVDVPPPRGAPDGNS